MELARKFCGLSLYTTPYFRSTCLPCLSSLHTISKFATCQGVVGFISTGCEPLAVPQTIVDNVRSRCRDGVADSCALALG